MSSPSTSRRSHAGFWSSAKSFFLPVGQNIDPDGVGGYPIDMRVKAASAAGSPPEFWEPGALHVANTQYALGCYERWLHGEGEEWLQASLATARRLVSLQAPDGSWYHQRALRHTFPLPPPWASGITQGQGASLMVRLHLQTGEAAFAEAAERALAPLTTPQRDGGVQGEIDGLPWPEEYPTTPQSHVLNGAIFALWGFRDVAVGLGDGHARRNFEQGIASLATNLPRYDTGSWSLYSLFPHPILNRASSFYHDLHVNQLTAMRWLAPRPEFEATRERWAAYAASRYSRITAFAWKAAFRVLVPRDPRAARTLPWSHLRHAADV
ncbi:MAG TPA: D-glucuronyl C5-epimerase family protein [Solirubrobacteraceae bacterium]|nr:D-glucuronyl C5-epimerase family protein [Solirubrobacteraceae bacterium]